MSICSTQKVCTLLSLVALSSLFFTHKALAGAAQNSLVIGTTQEPPLLLDPWNTSNLAVATEINYFMSAGLTGRDNDGKQYADIAVSVPDATNKNYKEVKDKDGKVTSNSLTYTIRNEARWSDGTPITTADFEFWLKVQNDSRVPVPTHFPFKNARIIKKDSKTFTITYTPAFLFAQQVGAPGLAPAHWMKSGWESFDKATQNMSSGDEVNNRWNQFISQYTTSTHLPKVVAGPFIPTIWSPGNHLTMLRNPNYWRKPAGGENKYIQKVIYRFIPNTNTLKLNILSGQLDAVGTTGLTFDQALDMQKRQSNKYTTFFVPTALWEHIDLNLRGQHSQDIGLSDVRVRQAMLYALDRQGLVNTLYQGKQPVADTWVSPISPVYSPNITTYPYDVAKARNLLSSAGWKIGTDGILEKNGQKMKITLTTTAGNSIRERVQQILKDQWKKVGIEVQIQNYPVSVIFGPDFITKGAEGKWDMAMYAFSSDPLFEDGASFKGSAVPTNENGYSGDNVTGWSDSEYNRLQSLAENNFHPAQRKQQLAQMQAIWAKALPALPLYFRTTAYTRSNGLVNYNLSALTRYPTWDAYQIGWASRGAIEAHQQK